jgi:class 3 adenylate cyclase
MSLKQELEKEVATIFRSGWTTRDGAIVPADESVKLTNDAVNLTATVLYADLADSTQLVDSSSASFAAEIYKTFLHCAAKIIRSEDGAITAYDGDRIMAVYIGGTKNTQAVRSAMKINYAAQHIITPAMTSMYAHRSGQTVKHVVGIDTSELLVARTGVRGANDLVWVGRAANYAAKLATLPEYYPTYITKEVYEQMLEIGRTSDNGMPMWEGVLWNTFDNRLIYRSNWWWKVD